MKALIDADILVYRIGFTTENEDEFIARARFDEMVDGIILDTKADEYQLWLSDSTQNNFRLKYYPFYKANRKDQKKPKHYEFLKKYAIEAYGAAITPNQEADDALGISQTNNTVICSIDKDLLQIPGFHYNFVKKESTFVTPWEGLNCFYTQLLTGDTTDNIQGAPKVGPKTADKVLAGCITEGKFFNGVRDGYRRAYAKHIYGCPVEALNDDQCKFIDDQILMNGICLKIRQQEDEVWEFPTQQNLL